MHPLVAVAGRPSTSRLLRVPVVPSRPRVSGRCRPRPLSGYPCRGEFQPATGKLPSNVRPARWPVSIGPRRSARRARHVWLGPSGRALRHGCCRFAGQPGSLRPCAYNPASFHRHGPWPTVHRYGPEVLRPVWPKCSGLLQLVCRRVKPRPGNSRFRNRTGGRVLPGNSVWRI